MCAGAEVCAVWSVLPRAGRRGRVCRVRSVVAGWLGLMRALWIFDIGGFRLFPSSCPLRTSHFRYTSKFEMAGDLHAHSEIAGDMHATR